MAVGVVDPLEVVQIEKQDGRAATRAPLGDPDQPAQSVVEVVPIGQPGDRIVVRQAVEFFLGLLALGQFHVERGVASLDLRDHFVEAVGQLTDLVAAVGLGPQRIIAQLGHPVHEVGELAERTGDDAAEAGAEVQRNGQGHQGTHRQREGEQSEALVQVIQMGVQLDRADRFVLGPHRVQDHDSVPAHPCRPFALVQVSHQRRVAGPLVGRQGLVLDGGDPRVDHARIGGHVVQQGLGEASVLEYHRGRGAATEQVREHAQVLDGFGPVAQCLLEQDGGGGHQQRQGCGQRVDGPQLDVDPGVPEPAEFGPQQTAHALPSAVPETTSIEAIGNRPRVQLKAWALCILTNALLPALIPRHPNQVEAPVSSGSDRRRGPRRR